MHMKSLFRFSLCAFAALTLANCTNDLTEDGAQAPAERFSMTINAGLPDGDDSRTALGTDNGKYRILWQEEGETLTIAEVINGNVSDKCEATQITEDNRSTERFAVFTTSFAGASDVNSEYTYVACYPHSNANEFNPAEKTVTATMPAVQTPVEGSVDPKATLLFAQHRDKYNNTEVSKGRPYQINLKFAHAAAYAKMTLKDLPLYSAGDELVGEHAVTEMPYDEIIDQIIIKCTGADLAGNGTYKYSFDDETENSTLDFQSASTSSGSETITLNVRELEITKGKTKEGNGYTLFFAALPVDLENPEITITTVDGRTFTKTLDTSGGKEIKLKQGSMTAFTVGATGLNPTETDLVYARVYSRQQYTYGFRSVVKTDDGKTEYVSKEFIMLTMNGNAAYTFKNHDIEGTPFSKGVTVKDAKRNYEKFYLNNPGSNLYYIGGDDANEGKATDYTWIWDKNSSFDSNFSGTASILSTAAGATYLSSNDGNLVLGDKMAWSLDKNLSNGAVYFRIFAGGNWLDITASSASLAKFGNTLPVSAQVFIYTDEGLRFVKREDMDIIPEETPSTYYKYNTEKLVAFNKAIISSTPEIKTKHTPLVVTATANGKTYLISNETLELIEVSEDFQLENGTITGKLNSYVWDAAYLNPGYIFNSFNNRANGDGLLFIDNGTTSLVFDPSMATSFEVTPKLNEDENPTGDYTLSNVRNNETRYLTIADGKIVVSTAGAPTDVYFQFYGDTLKDIEDLAKDEAENKKKDGDVYIKATTISVGKEYIITTTIDGTAYTIANASSSNVIPKALTTDNGFTIQADGTILIKEEVASLYRFATESYSSGYYSFKRPNSSMNYIQFYASSSPNNKVQTNGWYNSYNNTQFALVKKGDGYTLQDKNSKYMVALTNYWYGDASSDKASTYVFYEKQQ